LIQVAGIVRLVVAHGLGCGGERDKDRADGYLRDGAKKNGMVHGRVSWVWDKIRFVKLGEEGGFDLSMVGLPFGNEAGKAPHDGVSNRPEASKRARRCNFPRGP
jgi:hypothetical protein